MNTREFNIDLDISLEKLLNGELLDIEEYQVINCASKLDLVKSFYNVYDKSLDERGMKVHELNRDILIAMFSHEKIFLGGEMLKHGKYKINTPIEEKSVSYAILDILNAVPLFRDGLKALYYVDKETFLRLFMNEYITTLKSSRAFKINIAVLTVLATGKSIKLGNSVITPLSKENYIVDSLSDGFNIGA